MNATLRAGTRYRIELGLGILSEWYSVMDSDTVVELDGLSETDGEDDTNTYLYKGARIHVRNCDEVE